MHDGAEGLKRAITVVVIPSVRGVSAPKVGTLADYHRNVGRKLVARPSGTAEVLEGIRKQALKLHGKGVPIPEIARRVNRTEAAVRRWVREAESPEFPVEKYREMVRLRLQTEGSAFRCTDKLHTSWTTAALPWAWGESYTHGYTGDPLDDLPFDYFVEWLLEWDCYQDEQGIWRAR